MAHGGARKGAGRPSGTKEYRALAKEAAREHVRARIEAVYEQLVDAAIAQALGLKFLVVRDKKDGKFRGRIRTEKQFDAALKNDAVEIAEVWGQAPNMTAFQTLMDRFLDKAKEQELDVNVRDKTSEEMVRRLHAARDRVAAAAKAGKVVDITMPVRKRRKE